MGLVLALSAVGGLVGLLLVLASIGLALRPDHRVARTAVVPGTTAEVWTLLIDVAGQVRWRTDLRAVDPLPAVEGKRAFRERRRHDAIAFVVDEEVAPVGAAPGRLVHRIADERLPFGGRWIIQVTPEGEGATRVTVTEDGVIRNPIFRVLSRTVYSLTATQEAWLRDLGRALGAEVTPAPAEPMV